MAKTIAFVPSSSTDALVILDVTDTTAPAFKKTYRPDIGKFDWGLKIPWYPGGH